MLEALTITLREGVEAALIVGITLAYLAKIQRNDLRKAVYLAIAAAVAGSVAVAVVIAHTGFNEDIFEGWVMLAAAFFVITMIVFMAKTAKHLKGDIERKVGSMASRSSRLGLFAFVFIMVLREGVETVLILSAVSLNSTELMNAMGTIIGIALAVLFAVTFIKGSVRINLQKFFKVTTVILVFVAFQLVVSGLHELSENGILPSSRQEMALIGPIVRNDLFFFVTILALAALMILFEYRRRSPAPEASPESKAAARKAAWTARRERLWMAAVYGSAFVFIVLVTAQFIYARTLTALSPATLVAFHDNKIVIPVAQVNDGDLHRYVADVDGTSVRFFFYRRPDGKIASVFDACEICGAMGFYQTSQGVVCKNCAAPINPQSVGQPGGCNPIPLQSSTDGTAIEITKADLAAQAAYFRK